MANPAQARVPLDPSQQYAVAAMGEHYLKLRLTYYNDLKMRELMSFTVSELQRLAMTTS